MTVAITRQDAVAIVTIDNPPVNATSQAVRAGLMNALAETEADASIKVVVLACAGRTFVAGADVREFGAPPKPPHLPDVIAGIENASKPWGAALHGSVLGGGLELAMGCHLRIAATGTKLGLPEVTLGLIPGAGGTVRLPRLVDAETALTMVAGGKPISAAAALEAGLVDALAKGDLLQEAVALANTAVTHRPTITRNVVGQQDSALFEKQAAEFARKARGQISVGRAIEAVKRGLTEPADAALAAERANFLELKTSDQAQALRHIFFAERNTLKDPRTQTTPRKVSQIAVIGGGTMGAGIATACLIHGFDVTLVERDQAGLDAGRKRIAAALKSSAKRGIIADAAATLQSLHTTTDYADLSTTDLVIEAVFEDMEVKKAVFAQLELVTRPDAILATNTSYLDVNQIAATLKDPSRAIGLHFFSPAHVMKLLEIVLPDAVADDVVATAAALAKSLRKIGVLSGVCDGFIGNRIMSAYRREADFTLEDGATPMQVDEAMRDYGFPIGIYEMQDLAGLDIAWAMRKRKAASRPANERYSKIADRICALERFGRKTGAGWYDYVDGRAEPSSIVEAIIAEERRNTNDLSANDIMDRILGAMRGEAERVLAEGIARSAADIDVVMVNGYGFPRWKTGSIVKA